MSTTVSNPVTTAKPTGAAANTRAQRNSFDSTLRSARSTLAFREVISQAFDSFCASKTRFLLTMLGMVIGSASVILVFTLGSTGRQYAISQIASIGPNMIEMQFVGGSVSGPDNVSTPDYMTREDMNTVIEQVPGIIASSPMLEIHDRISIGSGVTKDTMLLGVSPQYKEVRNLRLLAGRFFDDQDAATHAKVAVIIAPLAQTLYGSYAQAIDHTISVSGIPFTVIGVFKESIETFGMSEVSDQTILIPYAVARYFQGSDTVKQIFFTVASSQDVEPAARRIKDVIAQRHRPSSVFNAFTLTEVLTAMNKIAIMLTIVLTLASAITLIVSGVGIMNSMLANVQSRIKEIGIRKALGATSREIRLQFLTEAVFLSLSGGLVGTVIGVAIPLSVRLFIDIKIPVSPWAAIVALATSVLVGVIFGTLPASRAAKLDPVTTLKYE
ncbi:MAG TPA: ABC transporter permease [Acidobacteriaceae bacterium]|jgi:putative ABC transport system permease protein